MSHTFKASAVLLVAVLFFAATAENQIFLYGKLYVGNKGMPGTVSSSMRVVLGEDGVKLYGHPAGFSVVTDNKGVFNGRADWKAPMVLLVAYSENTKYAAKKTFIHSNLERKKLLRFNLKPVGFLRLIGIEEGSRAELICGDSRMNFVFAQISGTNKFINDIPLPTGSDYGVRIWNGDKLTFRKPVGSVNIRPKLTTEIVVR